MDGRLYAVKKVYLDPRDETLKKKIIREVITLSRLHHQFIVRYYQAWIEDSGISVENTPTLHHAAPTPSSPSPSSRPHRRRLRRKTRVDAAALLLKDHKRKAQAAQAARRAAHNTTHNTHQGSHQTGARNDQTGGPDGDGEVGVDEYEYESAYEYVYEDQVEQHAVAHAGDNADPRAESALHQKPTPSSPIENATSKKPTRADASDDDDDDDGGLFGEQSLLGLTPSQPGGPSTLSHSHSHSNPSHSNPSQSHQTRSPHLPTSLCLYIQMEFCPNKSLRSIIGTPTLNKDRMWVLLRQITEGLAYLHSEGIIHRDLKPSNVFLDTNGDVKLGDFGLATRALVAVVDEATEHTPDTTVDETNTLTQGVGTPFYTAPELEAMEAMGEVYTEKVDMYALGVILFEMCVPFQTGIDRILTLNALRTDGVLPDTLYDADAKAGALVAWLVKRDPGERPTAMELLRGHLPMNVQDAYFDSLLMSIRNRDESTYQSRLLEVLFGQTSDEYMDIMYDIDEIVNPDPMVLEIRSSVMATLAALFARHGASHFTAPLTIPSSSLVPDSASRFLDRRGNVLALPFDLLLPLARFAGRASVPSLRRHAISRVYRRGKEMMEADLDFISPVSTTLASSAVVAEYEVLHSAAEVLSVFSPHLDDYSICVSHGGVVAAILLEAELPASLIPRAMLVVASKAGREYDLGGVIAQDLEVELAPNVVHTLNDRFSLNVPLPEAIATLEKWTKKKGKHRWSPAARGLLHGALESLRPLSKLVGSSKLLQGTRVDMCVSRIYNPQYYGHALMFQVGRWHRDSKKRDSVLAVGGRYDLLLSGFRPLPTLTEPDAGSRVLGGVGLSLSVDKIVSVLTRSAVRSVRLHEPRMGISVPIAIAALGERELLIERLALAERMWEEGMGAMLVPSDQASSMNELQAFCFGRSIPWLVMVKDKALREMGAVKVRSMYARTEVEVDMGDLLPFLARTLAAADTTLGASATLPRSDSHHQAMGSSLDDIMASSASSVSAASSAPMYIRGGGSRAGDTFEIHVISPQGGKSLLQSIKAAAAARVEPVLAAMGVSTPLVVMAIDKVLHSTILDCIGHIAKEGLKGAYATWRERHPRDQRVLKLWYGLLVQYAGDGVVGVYTCSSDSFLIVDVSS